MKTQLFERSNFEFKAVEMGNIYSCKMKIANMSVYLLAQFSHIIELDVMVSIISLLTIAHHYFV